MPFPKQTFYRRSCDSPSLLDEVRENHSDGPLHFRETRDDGGQRQSARPPKEAGQNGCWSQSMEAANEKARKKGREGLKRKEERRGKEEKGRKGVIVKEEEEVTENGSAVEEKEDLEENGSSLHHAVTDDQLESGGREKGKESFQRREDDPVHGGGDVDEDIFSDDGDFEEEWSELLEDMVDHALVRADISGTD